jgi:hypothetical protein
LLSRGIHPPISSRVFPALRIVNWSLVELKQESRGCIQRRRGSDKLWHPLAESQSEQSNTGNGDSEEEAVGNDLITHDGTYKSAQRSASCDGPSGGAVNRAQPRTHGLMDSLNRREQM